MIAEIEGLRKSGESVSTEWWKKVVVNNSDVASSCPEIVEMLLNEVVNPGLKFDNNKESQLLFDFLVERMWEVGFVCGIIDIYILKHRQRIMLLHIVDKYAFLSPRQLFFFFAVVVVVSADWKQKYLFPENGHRRLPMRAIPRKL